jgi:hypothetical protein
VWYDMYIYIYIYIYVVKRQRVKGTLQNLALASCTNIGQHIPFKTNAAVETYYMKTSVFLLVSRFDGMVDKEELEQILLRVLWFSLSVSLHLSCTVLHSSQTDVI